MKKYLFILSAGCVFLLSSCADKKTETSTSSNETISRNLTVNRTVAESFNTGDISKIDSVVAADFVDHTDRGELGRDSLKAGIVKMHDWDKTMKMEIVKEVADSNYAFIWVKVNGTSDGNMGIPKGPYSMNSVQVTKIKDGMAVEHWSFVDMQEMMKMMGGMKQPPMDHDMNKMDNDTKTKDTATKM